MNPSATRSALLERLTEEQRAVVAHRRGHARVAAVAGAGKTSTLAARVMALLDDGADPERMLVLMFNRAARDEFATRLQSLAAPGQRLPRVRTFHSIGHRLCGSLTRWGVLPARRLIEAEWQRERLARQAMIRTLEEYPELGEEALEPERLEAFGHFCERVKGELVAPEQMVESDDFGAETRHFPTAYRMHESLLEAQGLMTYADLLHHPLRALARDPSLRLRIQGFLDHVIVDEYQDINEAQLRLLALLAAPHGEVMAVGDANQCIYEWRGARVDAMLERFDRCFGKPTDYPLSYTFRHGHALALLANHAIAANRRRPDQLTLAAPGTPQTTIEARSGARALIETLEAWLDQGRPLDQAAVLVRSWTLSVPVQLRLLRAGIPFQLGREDRFVFRLPLVRALAGYLELALQPRLLADPAHLMLLFSQPSTFVARERLERICHRLAESQRWLAREDALLEGLKPIQRRNLKKRWSLLCELPRLAQWSPARLLAKVIETLDAEKLLRRAAARREKGEEDVRLLDVLLEQAGELADDTAAFVALLKNPVEARTDGVVISTIHGAKGLEWPLVAVWGLNEEDCPLYGREMPLTPSGLEEERRLFYVAVTRAKERLALFDDGGERRPSRFLAESGWEACTAVAEAMVAGANAPIAVSDPALVERYLHAFGQALALRQGDRPSLPGGWRPGEWIEHATFGRGEIELVEGEGERCILEVRFSTAGKRRLLAARAPIEPA
ncbi:ATP-dependent helicase [Halotalea alkalilenta]|uniref:ATP-dependent helicase n=1 Tax=Halotalea alkalilenta TaxID=376489 RepID=UPI000B0A0ED1|nr:ATP-dependent helicase [Halotalea alkalilenta]